jgi:hypothetical protein
MGNFYFGNEPRNKWNANVAQKFLPSMKGDSFC